MSSLEWELMICLFSRSTRTVRLGRQLHRNPRNSRRLQWILTQINTLRCQIHTLRCHRITTQTTNQARLLRISSGIQDRTTRGRADWDRIDQVDWDRISRRVKSQRAISRAMTHRVSKTIRKISISRSPRRWIDLPYRVISTTSRKCRRLRRTLRRIDTRTSLRSTLS